MKNTIHMLKDTIGRQMNSFIVTRGSDKHTHTFKTVEVRGWMEELGVKKNYVIKDGTQVCEL